MMWIDMTEELDYPELLMTKLKGLRHFERCIFSAWCCDRLLSLMGESTDEVASLCSILNEIWDVLLSGTIPEKALLNLLDENFEDSAPDGFNDIDALDAIGRNAVGILILGCRRNDVGLSLVCGEAVLEATLRTESPESVEDASLDHPEMRQEFDTQLAMIKYLRGEYELGCGLRSM